MHIDIHSESFKSTFKFVGKEGLLALRHFLILIQKLAKSEESNHHLKRFWSVNQYFSLSRSKLFVAILLHPSPLRNRNFVLSGRSSRSAQMAFSGVIVAVGSSFFSGVHSMRNREYLVVRLMLFSQQ